jgi:hypothetical protein
MIAFVDLKIEQIGKKLKKISSGWKVSGQNLAGQKFAG